MTTNENKYEVYTMIMEHNENSNFMYYDPSTKQIKVISATDILTANDSFDSDLIKPEYVLLPSDVELLDKGEVLEQFEQETGDYPKVCVNLYTDVRYTYQYGGLFYGKKKRYPTKSSNERNDA